MRVIGLLGILLLASCSMMPANDGRVKPVVGGYAVEPGDVKARVAWWQFSHTALYIGGAWNRESPREVEVAVSVPGYADIDRDGLIFRCEAVAMEPGSADAKTFHAVGGESSTRRFTMSRDDFARLLSCKEIEVVVLTSRGPVEGVIEGRKDGEGIRRLRKLADRIARIER